jgi:hypothetical protein
MYRNTPYSTGIGINWEGKKWIKVKTNKKKNIKGEKYFKD